MKKKLNYTCTDCGALSQQWKGQCNDCGSWNSMTQVVLQKAKSKTSGYAGETTTEAIDLKDIDVVAVPRNKTGLDELDRVLGGGLVLGSIILLGGDPGIGKSTLLLQTVIALNKNVKSLYVTGEESLVQVKLRANRLKLEADKLSLLAETQIESILNIANKIKPNILIIDSIQTMMTDDISSAAGSVSQVREVTAQLVRFAKTTGTIIFLIGHVTKDGQLAGPRILEHMVDTVLYFEGERDNKYRMIRAVKNRFGAVGEIGIFAMTDKGLKGINNPSAIFISKTSVKPGSIIMATWEGTRPILVEIQALVDESHLANPRRVILGFDPNRLALLLAVLNRHGGIQTYNQDVFINVVGGVKISETAIDLPALLAVVSSLKNLELPKTTISFGEVGLSGEIRPVQCGQERLKEAAKLGFKRAIIAQENAPKNQIKDLEVCAVKNIQEALNIL